MASLDVEALFTNISFEETINICVELAFNDSDKVEGMHKDQLRTLLSLATKKSLILFNGSYYKQIDGVTMGSPLGPKFADIFSATMREIGSLAALLTSVHHSTDAMLMTSFCSSVTKIILLASRTT